MLLLITALIDTYGVEAKRKVALRDLESLGVSNQTLADVEKAIKFALLDMNWVPREINRDVKSEMLATLNVYSHFLTVKIVYDSNEISLSYHDSTNLRYLEEDGNKFIHSAYFEWTDWLIDEIESNLKSTEYEYSISDVCFNNLVSQEQMLVNNSFKLSRGRLAAKVCSNEALQVVVSDQRPYILAGKKKRTFSGLRRMSYRIPISFNAKKEYTTAESVAEGIRLVLERAIPRANSAGILDNQQIDDYVRESGYTDKLTLITLNEWKYDKPPKGFGKAAFYYDLDVVIKGKGNGKILASYKTEGKRMVKNIKSIKEDYAWVLETIFDSSDVRKAVTSMLESGQEKADSSRFFAPTAIEKPRLNLKTNAVEKVAKSSEVKKSCSIEQILKMSGLGLTKSQIEAACTK